MDSEGTPETPILDAQGHPFERDSEVAPCGCSLLPDGELCGVHAAKAAAPTSDDLFDAPPLVLTEPPDDPEVTARLERQQRAVEAAQAAAAAKEAERVRADGILSIFDPDTPLAGEMERQRWEILRGDSRLVMKRLPADSYDGVVCDPPYGMSVEPDVAEVLKHWLAGDEYEHLARGGFMGRTWDSFVPGPEFWREAYRVLKPGAYLAAYSSTRTWDLLSIAIRMAGFEIRDTCMWVYGCLSADTEVLLQDGRWVRHGDLDAGDVLMGYDPAAQTFRWMSAQAVQRYGYDDTAYRLVGKHTDQIVSRNHRCPVYRDGAITFVAAESLPDAVQVPVIPDRLAFESACGLANPAVGAEGDGGVYLRGLRNAGMEPRGMAAEGSSADMLSGLQWEAPGSGVGPVGGDWASGLDRGFTGVVSRDGQWTRTQVVGRRGDKGQEEGTVSGATAGAVSAGVLPDGDAIRVRRGAPTGGGASAGALPTPVGCRAPRQPGHAGLQAGEPDGVRLADGSQAIRADGFTAADLVRVERLSYRGIVWCPTVETGAFVARRNGRVFVTGNSGMPKGLNVFKALDKMLGQTIACPDCQGVPHEERGRPSDQADMFAVAEWEAQWANYVPSDDPCEACKGKGTIRLTPDEAKKWKGWNTALKPSWEPIIVARKPMPGSVVENVLKYGVGPINIDACRIGDRSANPQVQGTYIGSTVGVAGVRMGGKVYTEGRYPANVLMTHCPDCRSLGTKDDNGLEQMECVADCPVTMMDAQSGVTTSTGGKPASAGAFGKNGIYGGARGGVETAGLGGYGDTGGASRFFYSGKASRGERDAGLEDFPIRTAGAMAGRQDGSFGGEIIVGKNPHPTVKPISVMRWLTKLLVPPGGKVLDIFAGSGSEGCACVLDGYRYTGIELDADDEGMCDIARARIRYWEREGERAFEQMKAAASQISLFGDDEEAEDGPEYEESTDGA